MKYILITGGVMSDIGKCVVGSSIAAILKEVDQEVTAIKVDPYLDVNSSKKSDQSPKKKGEIYVVNDGSIVDADLGRYERLANINVTRNHHLTSGKMFMEVLQKKEEDKTINEPLQVVPHMTGVTQDWIERVSKIPVGSKREPDVCIIELGGTVGEAEGFHFLESLRQLRSKVKPENFCVIHVCYVPRSSATGLHKTKPTQLSVKQLRGLGLEPDFIVCRSELQITESTKTKVSIFCSVEREKVISIPDVENLLSVPLVLERQNFLSMLNENLHLDLKASVLPDFLNDWKSYVKRMDSLKQSLSIVLVHDSQLEAKQTSIKNALCDAATSVNQKVKLFVVNPKDLEEEAKISDPMKYFEAWKSVSKSHAILVTGDSNRKGFEGKVAICNWARKSKHPFLGIGSGMHAAVVEFARNVLEMKDADIEDSQSVIPDALVIKITNSPADEIENNGGFGLQTTVFTGKTSRIQKLYGNVQQVDERHRNKYQINPYDVKDLETSGMTFVGKDITGTRVDAFELEPLPFFVGLQYYPEFLTRTFKPSPPYVGLLLAASEKLQNYYNQESPLKSSSDEDISTDEDKTNSSFEILN